jgi:beta-mannosidase
MTDRAARDCRHLHEGWTVIRTGGTADPPANLPSSPITAAVPGVVHLDLIHEDVLPHPDRGDGEAAQAWVGRSDWRYARTITADDVAFGDVNDGDIVELVFDSIDTVATVRLGERVLGSVENQFHPHRFRVNRDDWREGVELAVELTAPMDELDRRVAQFGDRPVNADGAWGVYSYLRKAACSFGWDWGPMCPSVGLPGAVRIERWHTARIDAVRPLVTTCNDRLAIVETHVDLVRAEHADGGPELTVRATITAPDGRCFEATSVFQPGATSGVLRFEIPDPKRWWPRGLGEQPLHDLEVTLAEGDNTLDREMRRVGLRIVALDNGRDPEGSRFRIVINGEAVFCKGANWIPDGLFPGTSDESAVRRRIEQAVDAGFNMLRVWGGGTYESDAFHDACDELGIMVWQDFMFACATYPEEAPYPDLIEREARHQVARLASHPSLVIWCGGNENVLAWRNWGWKERMDPAQSWGRRYFTELLPAITAELDPSRPFVPDSPWSGSVEADPNDPDHGDRHTWDLKVEEVRELVPRFVSEFGHQAPPNRRTIEEALGAEALASESPEAMAAFGGRQRGWGGDQAQYDRWLDEWFSPAADLDGRLWRMQLLQARATTFSYEWLRLNQPRCGGALIWQLNDAWTGHSWSLIDVAGRPKPSWWAARHACAARLLAFTVGESGIEIGGVNDDRDDWTLSGRIRRIDVDGRDLAVSQVELLVPASGAATVPVGPDLAIPEDPSRELLVAEFGEHRAFWFYGKDAWLSLPEPVFEVTCNATADDATEIELRATTLLRDLHIDIHRLHGDASIDRNLVTLLPGEALHAMIRGAGRVEVADLATPGVIRTANTLAAGGMMF